MNEYVFGGVSCLDVLDYIIFVCKHNDSEAKAFRSSPESFVERVAAVPFGIAIGKVRRVAPGNPLCQVGTQEQSEVFRDAIVRAANVAVPLFCTGGAAPRGIVNMMDE